MDGPLFSLREKVTEASVCLMVKRVVCYPEVVVMFCTGKNSCLLCACFYFLNCHLEEACEL